MFKKKKRICILVLGDSLIKILLFFFYLFEKQILSFFSNKIFMIILLKISNYPQEQVRATKSCILLIHKPKKKPPLVAFEFVTYRYTRIIVARIIVACNICWRIIAAFPLEVRWGWRLLFKEAIVFKISFNKNNCNILVFSDFPWIFDLLCMFCFSSRFFLNFL